MKKFVITFLALALFGFSFGQKVTVTQREQKVEKLTRTGLAIFVELDKKEVLSEWKKQLKEFGKTEKDGDFLLLTNAKLPTVSSKPVNVISLVENTSDGTMVWWAIDLGDKWVVSGGSGYSAAEKILHDFGVQSYTEDVNQQIADAEKALEKANKEFDKSVKEGNNLKSDLERNGERKEELEQMIVDNADEKVQLEDDIERNKGDQEAAQSEVERMKKALELVTKKLDAIQ